MAFGKKFQLYTRASFKSLGQIMLQENAETGLYFLIGIFIGSFQMGIAAILSVVCGLLTAIVFKFDAENIKSGLYGFSAALVGVALMLFYKPSVIIWISICVGSVLAALLQHFFIKKRIAVFTLPFVLITWSLMFILNRTNIAETNDIVSNGVQYVGIERFLFGFRGIGQVIFQNKTCIGLIFFLGILKHSPIAAIYALAGALLSGIFAFSFNVPTESIMMGLFSYNAVLCAIVFAGKRIENIIYSILSVLLSLIIGVLMYRYDLTQLTFPFVLASIITLKLKSSLIHNREVKGI